MMTRTPTAAAARHGAVCSAALAGGGFLTFRLGGLEYGIDIMKVQEIRSYEQPTRLADAPLCVKGVVNLRGAIVPIVDLRLRLGCETVVYSARTVVVVLNLRGRVIGAVVDSVCDVLELPNEDIKPAPAMASVRDAGFVTGICSVTRGSGQRTLILMDIEAMMASQEMGFIAA